MTGHAEANLMRMASALFEQDFLESCTLHTSTEPCAMCAGAIYLGQRPPNAHGDHEVEVGGPHFLEEARAVHDDFWD